MRCLIDGACLVTSSPKTVDRPGVRFAKALEDLDGRGLAGPVRTEHAEDLAAPDLEADSVDGLHVAVALLQVGDADDAARRFASSHSLALPSPANLPAPLGVGTNLANPAGNVPPLRITCPRWEAAESPRTERRALAGMLQEHVGRARAQRSEPEPLVKPHRRRVVRVDTEVHQIEAAGQRVASEGQSDEPAEAPAAPSRPGPDRREVARPVEGVALARRDGLAVDSQQVGVEVGLLQRQRRSRPTRLARRAVRDVERLADDQGQRLAPRPAGPAATGGSSAPARRRSGAAPSGRSRGSRSRIMS